MSLATRALYHPLGAVALWVPVVAGVAAIFGMVLA